MQMQIVCKFKKEQKNRMNNLIKSWFFSQNKSIIYMCCYNNKTKINNHRSTMPM